MKIHCAFCGKPFEKDSFESGGMVECPHCGESFDLANRQTLGYDEETGPDPESLTGKHIGGIRIVREIGRGGMGIVFEGVQESLGRKVAVKVLYKKTCKEPHFVARFEREAESLARLSHPNIINILDRGCEGDVYYFVMEFVDGVSLRTLMDEGPIESKEALAVIPPLCEALEYAHAEGVIHRDIKPENILIDKQGRVKVADFGLSRIVAGGGKEQRITRSNMIMGTPDYMAPEQRLDSKGVDHRADIYALGVILYEMLTGELPVGHFPPPSYRKELRIDVRLDDVVLKVLDKDPERRYQKASDIATDLQRISQKEQAAREDVHAYAPPPPSGTPAKEAAGSRSLLVILEDGWESWVLILVIIFTIIDFFPNVLLLVGWFALYKNMRRRRLERARAKKRNVSGEPASSPTPPEPPRPPASPGPSPSAPEAPAPPAPPAKAAGSAREAASERGPARRTSFLAILSALYAVAMVLAIPVLAPFWEMIEEQYASLTPDKMRMILSVSALGAILPLAGFLVAIIARTRIKVHDHLGGAFLAMIGIAGPIILLGVGARQWADAHAIYRRWADLETKIRQGDPEAVEQLREFVLEPRSRTNALRIAGHLDPEKGRAFFQWADSLGSEWSRPALIAWAEAYADDPASRDHLLGRARDLLDRDDIPSRILAVELLANLPGKDALDLLSRAGEDADAGVREEAAEAAKTWRKSWVASLAQALASDPVRDVAEEGLEALEALQGALPREEYVSRLLHVLKSSPHSDVKRKACQALRRMARGAPWPGEAIEVLETAAASGDRALAQEASETLERIRSIARSRPGRDGRRKIAKSAHETRPAKD